MREIKFRAWDKKEKSWLCTDMEYQECFAVQNSQAVKSGMAEVEGWLQPIYDVEIMQFTGLKDKNGKEIYEGDIYKHLSWEIGSDGNEYSVWREPVVLESIQEFFEEKGYSEGELMESYSSENLEVIGNIYENPELIQSK